MDGRRSLGRWWLRMSEAVVLLSGGLDSSTVLAMALERGFRIVALTFDYGQRHRKEIDSATRIARHFGVKEHIIVPLDLGRYLSSSLTQDSISIPSARSRSEIGTE